MGISVRKIDGDLMDNKNNFRTNSAKHPYHFHMSKILGI
jgi:hypothetical protein